MSKKLVFLIIIVVLAASFYIGYTAVNRGYFKNEINKKSTTNEPGRTAEPTKNENLQTSTKDSKPLPEEIDPIKKQIAGMTLDEKIGQMVLVGFDGYDINDNTRQMIDKYHVGGFILFKPNVKDSQQLLSLINALKTANSVNRIPLFMSVDEEGGRVSRMPAEFVKLPTNRSIGRINDSKLSYNIGSAIAGEIKAFGFNMDFAPVLDINSNPKNPVIGDRSFGTNAAVVSKLGVQTMKGITSQKVISVVKHFPGHGDTSVDSHIGLPTVNNSLDRLRSFELIPFANAIKNGVDVVMIAHILLPKIDRYNPASFSKTIISDVLRGELGYKGVVITDDMTMGAITKNYNMGEAAVKSVNAGSDIILVCHEYEKQTAVIEALKNAAESGAITKERIDESVYRILKLKQKYALTDKIKGSVDVRAINSIINKALGSYFKAK